MNDSPIAALFVRADSVYKTLPGVDAYDLARNALTYDGIGPVIAHPPCRAWGRLRGLATIIPEEKALAVWAVNTVRRLGGVLEHPQWSTLWPACKLPPVGEFDDFGGWTLPIHQFWFGHRAEKRTWLYIVGCAPAQIPSIPLVLGEAPCTISTTNRKYRTKPETTKPEREHTPVALAQWLVDLAGRCKRSTAVEAA